MTDAAFFNEIDAFIRENRESILRDIARICAVPSVNGPAEEGKPFGAGPAEALDTALAMAEEMGLRTKNCEGYLGYASLGEGKEYLATICHLDVVPAGDGWQADPFTVREREGWLIGRGVMDDKGPAILTLYLLKFLKEKNIPLNHEIRALLGVNEEIGMKDVDYYLEHYTAPKFCFTPDAAFPVCNGEKGIFHGKVISRAKRDHVRDIRGGVAGNAVPAKAEAWVIAGGELPSTERVAAEKEGDLWHLTATGKSGHAAHPGGAINAIGLLVDYLLEHHIPVPEEARYFRVLQKIHAATDGSGIGVAANDGKFDALTLVGSVIGVDEEGRFFQVLDSRYPTNTSGEQIRATIEAASEGAAKVVTDGDAPPFFIEADQPEIRSLIETFNTVTGTEAKPFTMGGGTYARHFPNAASFGAENFTMKAPEWVGGVHGPEEGGNIEWLMTALKIYIAAMIELDRSLD